MGSDRNLYYQEANTPEFQKENLTIPDQTLARLGWLRLLSLCLPPFHLVLLCSDRGIFLEPTQLGNTAIPVVSWKM